MSPSVIHFSGGLGSPVLKVGLHDFQGLLQLMILHNMCGSLIFFK